MGGSCAPTLCQGGTQACAMGDASTCVPTGSPSELGTPCGNGLACNATGSCSCVGFGGTGGPISVDSLDVSVLEAETQLTRTASGKTAVAWIAELADGNSTIGYRFLPDGGCDVPGEIQSPNGRVASDPVLATDAEDNVYVVWIGFKYDSTGQPMDMHVYVAVAPAGTIAFGAPIEVTSNVQPTDAFDKPWISVTDKDTVLVTYAKTSSGGIYAARSTNQGQTWSNTVIVEDGSFRNLVYSCPPKTGDRIFVTYVASGGIGLHWSDDDGVTWPSTSSTAVAQTGDQPAFDDPTCVATGTDVWVSYGTSDDAFTESIMPKLKSIKIAHSTNDGVSIADWHEAKDPRAMFAMHPQLVLEPSGQLDIIYYTGNRDMDTMGTFRWSKSTDGGATWSLSQTLFQPLEFIQSRESILWLGDYAGAVWDGGILYTTFTENNEGAAHIAVQSTPTD
jgi:hypothetical protein